MKAVSKVLPKYAYIPVISLILLNTIAYTVTKFITDGGYHYDFSLPWDYMIPFVPPFILIYVLSYAQWFFGFGFIAKESRDVCYRVISAEIIAKLICLVIFLVFPSIMERPEVTGNDIFSKLTSFIYFMDTPTNLFPSVHCLESWILFRTAFEVKRYKKWGVAFHGVFALLVFASVLLVRQHLILDIPSAIIIAEIGFLVQKKFRTERIFEKLEKKFIVKEKQVV